MSTAQNNIVREVNLKSLFESALPVLSTAVTYNQGDYITFDQTNLILAPVTGSGSSANILGIARQTIVNGIAKSPYIGTAVDASQAIEDLAGPAYGVVAFMTLKTGDAFNPGSPVYLTADPQTVTSVSAGVSVGVYQDSAVSSAAAGQQGDILIGARYGLSGIQY